MDKRIEMMLGKFYITQKGGRLSSHSTFTFNFRVFLSLTLGDNMLTNVGMRYRNKLERYKNAKSKGEKEKRKQNGSGRRERKKEFSKI